MPYKLKKVQKVAELYGLVLEIGKGKHPYKLRAPDGRMFPIPVHKRNGEVLDVYIPALCRTFSIDLDEFRRRLAGGKRAANPGDVEA